MNKLLAPESIAIIGASRKEGSLGNMFLKAVMKYKYKGTILPINPKADEIEGITCYSDIDHLPLIPDMAVILLPKNFVLNVLESLGEKGVKYVVVISAGFKETGKEGAELENKLIRTAGRFGMRLVGPNSMGLFNTFPAISLNSTFSPTAPIAGHTGFISQSGALGVAILELSARSGLGFSVFVSTGNKADLSDLEILDFMINDDNTKFAMLYMESIDNPDKFREVATRFVAQKPLLILKAGKTASGLKAASSHTGALASDDVIADAFLRQCGALRCETLQDLMDSAYAFENLPLPADNRVAVVTNAGGPGILASDALELNGLKMAEFTNQTISDLGEILPEEAAVSNPVDMIASATHDRYKTVCQILDKDKNVSSVVIIIVKPPVNTTPALIAQNLESIIRNSNKPFFIVLMAQHDADAGINIFRDLNLPVFDFPESAARSLGKMVRYKTIQDNFSNYHVHIPESRVREGSNKQYKQASYVEITKLFKKYNLPLCPSLVTENIDEALDFFADHHPVALKVANEEIIHKSDSGMVKLNISNEEKVRNEFENLRSLISKQIESGSRPQIVLQKMISGDIELVLGAKKDIQFGHVVMFGLGGIFVELYKDVSFRVLPVDEQDIMEMIEEVKGTLLLKGFRKRARFNLENLVTLIKNINTMLLENPHIAEMDMNPLIWPDGEQFPVIVDFRMTVEY